MPRQKKRRRSHVDYVPPPSPAEIRRRAAEIRAARIADHQHLAKPKYQKECAIRVISTRDLAAGLR